MTNNIKPNEDNAGEEKEQVRGIIVLGILFIIGVFLMFTIFYEPYGNNYQSYFTEWFLDLPIIGNALGYVLIPLAFVSFFIGGVLLFWNILERIIK